MSYPQIYLSKAKENSIVKKRHPWLFSQAIAGGDRPENGEVVDVYQSDRKTFFGRGTYNEFSQIRVRLFTRDADEPVDQAFFEKKFRELKAFRERWIDTKNTNAYRLVFGESDGLPGLIVDRYADAYVFQIHTAGMEWLRSPMVKALNAVFKPKTLYERSDVNVRLLEGLKDCPSRLISGQKITGEIEIMENGVRMLVNIAHGQKTGFFIDQRENRKALQKYSRGRSVLNCFSYTAGFSLYAALAGAKKVVSVDVSKEALQTARRNFILNGLSPNAFGFEEADVFDYLDGLSSQKSPFDLIILDPPAFVKNQRTLKNGMAGYLHINEKALRLLPVGGILVTSSCSAFVTDELFQQMLSLAAHHARAGIKVLEIKHQPPDHPYNIDFPEGKYLKFWVCEKVTG